MNIKKKIVFATAAALAIAGISTAAQAAPLSVTVNAITNTTTSAAPATVLVPSTNVIDAGHSLAITATADNGTTVSFSANGVRLVSALSTVDAPKTTASGISSIAGTSTGAPITVYVYTTTTAVGSVTITNGAYSTIVYVSGIAGSAYNLALSVPSATAVGTIPTIALLTTDVFNNPVSDGATVTLIGSTFTGGAVSSLLTTSAVTNVNTGAVLGTATASLSASVAGEVTVVATGLAAVSAVTGLPAPIKSVIAKFTVSDLNATIANLKLELADTKATNAKALADAKVASDKALADAKVSSDAALTKALADANATHNAEYNALVVKYNKLVASYLAKASKYKFNTTLKLVASK